MEDIILLGIGGHAHSVVDSIEQCGKYRIVGFLDTVEKQGETYKEYKVIGTDDMLERYYHKGIRYAFITVGYLGKSKIREKLYEKIKEIGYRLPNIIDESAIMAKNVKMGEGSFVGKRAVVNANSEIGNMCIVNTGAIIEHDCIVGDMSHIAVGTIVCGQTKIGESTFVGANSVIRQGIQIGSNAIIGAGSVVVKNVSDSIIKYGNVEKRIEG